MSKERKSIGFGNGKMRSSRKGFTLIELLVDPACFSKKMRDER